MMPLNRTTKLLSSSPCSLHLWAALSLKRVLHGAGSADLRLIPALVTEHRWSTLLHET